MCGVAARLARPGGHFRPFHSIQLRMRALFMQRENPGRKLYKVSNWLALWLAVMLSGLLLAACGSDAGRSLTTQSNATTAPDPTTASATTAATATTNSIPATTAPTVAATIAVPSPTDQATKIS